LGNNIVTFCEEIKKTAHIANAKWTEGNVGMKRGYLLISGFAC